MPFFKSHYSCMLWWEPLRSIAFGKGVSLRCWATGAKGEGCTGGGGVSLPEQRARWGGGTRHFYLCCADSARLSLREADEEEWPWGRTNWAHLYLSSSSESWAAESAAPPPSLPLPRMDGKWPVCIGLTPSPSASRSARPPSAARHFPCRHGSMSASLSPTLNTGLHSSSTPAFVTVAISQGEGKSTEVGKNSKWIMKKKKQNALSYFVASDGCRRILWVEICPGLNGGGHKGRNYQRENLMLTWLTWLTWWTTTAEMQKRCSCSHFHPLYW